MKKAQVTPNLSMFTIGAVMFIALIITLIVGANIASNLRTNIDRGSVSITNESDGTTLLWSNNTRLSLDNTEVSITKVYNCTDAQPVDAGFNAVSTSNYTLDATAGTFLVIDNATLGDAEAVCVNYTFTDKPAAYNVSLQGETNFGTFGDYLGVIATIIVLVVIVGLLIGVITLFARSR